MMMIMMTTKTEYMERGEGGRGLCLFRFNKYPYFGVEELGQTTKSLAQSRIGQPGISAAGKQGCASI
jgi:hypothetical protein